MNHSIKFDSEILLNFSYLKIYELLIIGTDTIPIDNSEYTVKSSVRVINIYIFNHLYLS